MKKISGKAVKSIFFGAFLYSATALASGFTPEQIAKEVALYQKGDEWSVVDITEQDLQNPIVKKAYDATVQVGAASGIYLGKFNGKHIVATNSHAVGGPKDCKQFPPKVVFGADTWTDTTACVGAWPEIELALLVVKPYDINGWDEEQDEPGPAEYDRGDKAVAGRASNFAFSKIPEFQTPLINVGFGIAGDASPDRGSPLKISTPRMTADDDCRVLSQTGDARLLYDPDTINPLKYSAWSIAIACDISHGSSGSLMMNRGTGEVVAIGWTGTWPKAGQQHITSREIDEISRSNSPELWSRVNYAVPAFKIKEFLSKQIKTKKIVGRDAVIIRSILEK
ncbi:trypsin-like peptidase domain-containing protein [Bdellovibrio sp. HCB288]|uniref:trypsin-like peptidase domain-containing protein n=1 Tax=Bdellovibrio sp. HCB288 TaxID=3394355 RepID=UPI0039B6E873